MKCILLDDEPRALKILQLYCSRVGGLELAGVFNSATQALEYLQSNSVDLIFTDIQMPELSGFEMIASLKKKPLIILTTSYPEYAVKSYDVNAVDYLLKPFTYERFLKALAKVNDRLQTNKPEVVKGPDYFFVKSGTGFIQVRTNEVMFFEKRGNYILIHTSQENIITRLSFQELMNIVNDPSFYRIHKSYIVSLVFIDKIEGNTAIIQKNKLPIGSSFKESFLEKIKKKTQ